MNTVANTTNLSSVAEDTRELLNLVRERLNNAFYEVSGVENYSGQTQSEAAASLLALIGDMSSALNIAYREVDEAVNG